MLDSHLLLTHWGRVTHICIVSDNGLSPGLRLAIIRTNAGILLIRPLGTNFIQFLFEILIFSLKKNALESVVCEKAAILSRPQWVNLALVDVGAIMTKFESRMYTGPHLVFQNQC